MIKRVTTLVILGIVAQAALSAYSPASNSILPELAPYFTPDQYLCIPYGYPVLAAPLDSHAPVLGPQTTIDGNTIPLTQPGKITIWHFFSVACPSCWDELAAIQEFTETYRGDVAVIAFGTGAGNDAAALSEVRERLGLDFDLVAQDRLTGSMPALILGVLTPHMMDDTGPGVRGELPVTFFVDQDGIIRFVTRNEQDWETSRSLKKVMVEELLGHEDEAGRLLEEYLEVSRLGGAVEMNNAAWTMAEAGFHLDEARDLAEEAVNRYPLDPYCLGTLGTIYFLRGEYDEAYAVLTVSIPLHEYDETKAVDVFYLGLTNLAMGEYCAGLANMIESLSLEDNSFYAVYAYAVLDGVENYPLVLDACFAGEAPLSDPQ